MKYTSLMPQKNNYEPNDGKDGGVPGDARELLFLAHQLDTEGQLSIQMKSGEKERDLSVKAMR